MIERTFQIGLSAHELAREFVGLDSDEMAEFFSMVGGLTNLWEKTFDMQMAYVTESEKLTPRARAIMETIGDYARN